MGPDLSEALNALSERLAEGRSPRMALTALRAAQAIHPFARLWIDAYDAAKARRRWLDFDDLIRLARRLLENPSVAQWVLYKLDGGIDQILVDEAQDTSPQQWRVIQYLTEEFTAGLGARDTNRTVFVVGDRKQSIYSFQGADLKGFEATRADMGARMADSGQALRERALRHSFRSSPAVLRYVDAVFADPPETGLGEAPEHLAFHGAL
jgi:ATP-dependent helicase/nuclease subunit A